jgi:hypothetical protein
MMNLRQVERNWEAHRYQEIVADLLATRVEALMLPRLLAEAGPCAGIAAAASAIIRLDELGLSDRPLCAKLIRVLLASQLPDGSWGDLPTTALALRALLAGYKDGLLVARAIEYFAALQREDGSWPEVALRRMPGDAATTAFILLQLADQASFAERCNVPAALTWLATHAAHQDHAATRLAAAAQRRLAAVG